MPERNILFRAVSLTAIAGAALLSPGCTKGPNYAVPAAPAPESFREAPPQGWKEAQPSDATLRGKWWEIFADADLDELEGQVAISNQNVLQSEANFRQARAAARAARSSLFPLVTASPGSTGTQSSSRLYNYVPQYPTGVYDMPLDASYTADVWGSIHRSVTASVATAQADAAQLENARLLYQADLAQDYFEMHGLDGDAALLEDTLRSYQEYLTLTRNRYAGGVASDADVAQAETQLLTTQSQLVDLEVQRSQLEHAIAILVGKPPSEFSIPRRPNPGPPPVIPVGLPSGLLERRPDIAQAERQAAAANQQIGIARAAFFPTLTFNLAAGVESTSFINWITWPARFWTLGPQAAQVLFDAGRRRANLEQAQAGYESSAASYRQTVLTAFQQVEDNLSALRVLENETAVLERAVKSAQRALTVSTAQYKAGTVDYLQVITSQTIALQDEKSVVDVQTRRMAASVLLIQALGGGWDRSQLPTDHQVLSR